MPTKFPYWNGAAVVEADTVHAITLRITVGGETHDVLCVRRQDFIDHRENFVEGFKRRVSPLSAASASSLADQMVLAPPLELRTYENDLVLGQRLPITRRCASTDTRREYWSRAFHRLLWPQIAQTLGGADPTLTWNQAEASGYILPGTNYYNVLAPTSNGYMPGIVLGLKTSHMEAVHVGRIDWWADGPQAIGAGLLTSHDCVPYLLNEAGSPDHLVAMCGYTQFSKRLYTVPDLASYAVLLFRNAGLTPPGIMGHTTETGQNLQGLVVGQEVVNFGLSELVFVHPPGYDGETGSQLMSPLLKVTDIALPTNPTTFAAIFDNGARTTAHGTAPAIVLPTGIGEASWLEALSKPVTWLETDLPIGVTAVPVSDVQLGLGTGVGSSKRGDMVLGNRSSEIDDFIVLSRWGGAERWETRFESATWSGGARRLTLNANALTIVQDIGGPTIKEGMRRKGYEWNSEPTALAITRLDVKIAASATETPTNIWHMAELHRLANADVYGLVPDLSAGEMIPGLSWLQCAVLARTGRNIVCRPLPSMPIGLRELSPADPAGMRSSLVIGPLNQPFLRYRAIDGITLPPPDVQINVAQALHWIYRFIRRPIEGTKGEEQVWRESYQTIRAYYPAYYAASSDMINKLLVHVDSVAHEKEWEPENLIRTNSLGADPRAAFTSDDSRKLLYLSHAVQGIDFSLTSMWEVMRATAYNLVATSDAQAVLRITLDVDPLLARGLAEPIYRGLSLSADNLIQQHSRGWDHYTNPAPE